MRGTTTITATTTYTIPVRFGNLAVLLWNKTPSTVKITARNGCCSRTTSSAPVPVPVRVPYIDEWYETIKKPNEFYERFSNGTPRRYFYNVDLQGRLYLEETSPKNIASSVKDEKFLDFFFSRIRKATARDLDFLRDYEHEHEHKHEYEHEHKYEHKHKYDDVSPKDYPFVSRCGIEINFVRPAATPVVFHTMVGGGGGGGDDNGDDDDALVYGGSITVPFRSDRLAVSKQSGKLFYRIACEESGKQTNLNPKAKANPQANPNPKANPKANTNSTNTRSGDSQGLEYGLIASPVAVALSTNIRLPEHHDDKFLYDGGTEIDWLPSHCEPGTWAMPNE